MADEPYIDFFELWQDKMFLGQEFLTWLWLCSEIDNKFAYDDQNRVEVWFENSLRLERGQGPSKKTVTCQSSDKENGAEWAEAFTAITKDKKVMTGRLRIRVEEREWVMSLPADTLSPKSLKMVSGADFDKKEDGQLSQVGALLDRVSYFIDLCGVIEYLLGRFFALRLSPEWESEELPRLRSWVARWIGEGL
jgi:recombination associated protein RdgC